MSIEPPGESLDENGISTWDRLVIGEFKFERTVVQLTGSGRSHKYNKKLAVGASGGIPTYQGTLPTEFTLSWLLWDEGEFAHFSTWEKLARIIAPPEAKTQPAKIKIFHPRLAFLNVSGREFFVDQVHPPADDGPQIVRVSIDITEASMVPKKKSDAKAPQRSSGEATEQARQRFNELAGQLATEENPLTRRQIQNQMDDIGRRYPVIGPPKPSKSATGP